MAKLSQFSFAFLCLCLLLSSSGVFGATFTIVNQCSHTVWPGILSGASSETISPSGFVLQPGQYASITIPAGWSGRFWGRTLCTQDSTGKFSCVTGDCGSGNIQCTGGAIPPATLAEFTLNGAGGLDFYDVSLVDGYNLPMSIAPQGGTQGNCSAIACAADVNGPCPAELRVASSTDGGGSTCVGCRSACDVFKAPEYCCNGEFSTPDKCKPSTYSEYFKGLCPQAYSYAYDDGTSTFTCSSFNYVISFCPPTIPTPPPSQRSAGGPAGGAVGTDMRSICTWLQFAIGVVTFAAALWWVV